MALTMGVLMLMSSCAFAGILDTPILDMRKGGADATKTDLEVHLVAKEQRMEVMFDKCPHKWVKATDPFSACEDIIVEISRKYKNEAEQKDLDITFKAVHDGIQLFTYVCTEQEAIEITEVMKEGKLKARSVSFGVTVGQPTDKPSC